MADLSMALPRPRPRAAGRRTTQRNWPGFVNGLADVSGKARPEPIALAGVAPAVKVDDEIRVARTPRVAKADACRKRPFQWRDGM